MQRTVVPRVMNEIRLHSSLNWGRCGRQISGLVIESCEATRLRAVEFPIAFGPGKRLKPTLSWFRICELFDGRVGAMQAS